MNLEPTARSSSIERGPTTGRAVAGCCVLAVVSYLAACTSDDTSLGQVQAVASSPNAGSAAARSLDDTDVPLDPPAAASRSYEVRAPHGAVREDEYYWLRDDAREDPDMLAYLEAENAYADAALAPLEALENTLYEELVGRLKQDDSTVPYRDGDYWYYTRYEEGLEYPIHARRRGTLDAAEEVMLDVNRLAAGHDFYQVANWAVSPDQRLLAYLEDAVGRRQYTLRIKDLTTGETLATAVTGLARSLAWAADSRTVFYVENDPETLLTTFVKRHSIGAAPGSDPIVYEELDDTFYVGVRATRSEDYLCIDVESTVSTESRCAPADAPDEFRVLTRRMRDFEYQADHLGDRWVIRTNWDAQNFKLMTVDEGDLGDRAAWRELLAHDPDVFVGGFELFDDFVAIGERSGGLTRIRILSADGAADYVAADEPAYSMWLARNTEPETDWLRYVYTSLTTPETTYELNVETGERRRLKEEPVLGGFDKGDYETERLWATARDGTAVPVSVVYRNGLERDGGAALLQYGYGSYGSSYDPEFDREIVSLLDRGVVVAIAHVRGGQELGRRWYEDGKLLAKRNTFTDFIDVTDFLVAEGYAHPERVAAGGGSAGGLLVGAVANMAPERYRVILSAVPFVDVVTTMLDPSIPLTTNEYDEWGNPENREYYDYILSYSPYDQLAARAYPAMFVTAGLWDSQVQYWEPAKYVARLRARKTDDRLVVFRVELDAGHGGDSGRFERYRDTAEQFAFLIEQLEVE